MGSTVPPAKLKKATISADEHADHEHKSGNIDFKDILTAAKRGITNDQNARLNALENAVIRGDVKDQQLHIYHQLARFWLDSAQVFEPYAYYTGEAAKLENSEKSLTFAARLFAERLMVVDEPAMQSWLASNGKVLFEKALQLNPNNDSNRIGLGACYIFGNISNNPMEGILPIRAIVDKDPGNIYAQMILGLGGKKSGQYDKAIERFMAVLRKEPANIEAIFHVAECYDLKGDKDNAIQYYENAKKLVAIPEAKKELEKRIEELKK
ncbi:MAG: tetratricopeptide repeat protein [Sediminibacterium sp.]|nr:tetratricopeptide repeat protein [Sediminibacterium sp.]